MYDVGLDLHKRYVTAWALNSAGQVVAAERRLPTTLEALVHFLGALGGPATVAVEATLHWAWVHRKNNWRKNSAPRKRRKDV